MLYITFTVSSSTHVSLTYSSRAGVTIVRVSESYQYSY